jgi:hypothetical protein
LLRCPFIISRQARVCQPECSVLSLKPYIRYCHILEMPACVLDVISRVCSQNMHRIALCRVVGLLDCLGTRAVEFFQSVSRLIDQSACFCFVCPVRICALGLSDQLDGISRARGTCCSPARVSFSSTLAPSQEHIIHHSLGTCAHSRSRERQVRSVSLRLVINHQSCRHPSALRSLVHEKKGGSAHE